MQSNTMIKQEVLMTDGHMVKPNDDWKPQTQQASSNILAMTTHCMASFCPKIATSGCTRLKNLRPEKLTNIGRCSRFDIHLFSGDRSQGRAYCCHTREKMRTISSLFPMGQGLENFKLPPQLLLVASC